MVAAERAAKNDATERAAELTAGAACNAQENAALRGDVARQNRLKLELAPANKLSAVQAERAFAEQLASQHALSCADKMAASAAAENQRAEDLKASKEAAAANAAALAVAHE